MQADRGFARGDRIPICCHRIGARLFGIEDDSGAHVEQVPDISGSTTPMRRCSTDCCRTWSRSGRRTRTHRGYTACSISSAMRRPRIAPGRTLVAGSAARGSPDLGDPERHDSGWRGSSRAACRARRSAGFGGATRASSRYQAKLNDRPPGGGSRHVALGFRRTVFPHGRPAADRLSCCAGGWRWRRTRCMPAPDRDRVRSGYESVSAFSTTSTWTVGCPPLRYTKA
jgi:hypothetical protein